MARRSEVVGRYVVARGASKRPTLQHVVGSNYSWTLCGLQMVNWSRAYQVEPIGAILCIKCRRLNGTPHTRGE